MKMRSVLLGAVAALSPMFAVAAQQPATPANVISIQPLSAMMTVYSGEYERRAGQNWTFGIGGTLWNVGDEGDELTYTSGDVKLRYYPGIALRGFSLGVSGGYTSVKETIGTTEASQGAPSFGALLEYQWLMGARSNVAVTLGAGAKMLFISEDDFSSGDFVARYPTARISVGYGF